MVQQDPEMFFSGGGKDVAKGLNTHKPFKWLEHLEVGPVSISVMSIQCLSFGELFSFLVHQPATWESRTDFFG